MNYNYFLKDLSCPNCAKKIEEFLIKEGFKHVNLQFATSMLSFTTDRKDVYKFVSKEIKKIDSNIIVYDLKKNIKQKNYNSILTITKLIIGILLVFLSTLTNSKAFSTFLLVLGYFILLIRVFRVSINLLKKEHRIDENFLIFISAVGACILKETIEGMMVITLYEIGKMLEAKAVSHTRGSITNLIDMKIKDATLYEKGILKTVPLESLKEKDIILIRKGEKVPTDGILKSEYGIFDTSMITGESLERKITKDEEIISGYINLEDPIEIEVTKPYKDSTAKRMLDLILNAPNQKAKTETMVSKIAKVYTPTVLIIAIIVFLGLPFITDFTYQESFYKALVFLIVSCPCSIAISVPLSYFSGIGRSSKEGILIKGSDFLDKLNQIDAIIFDKTGTITDGNLSIEQIKKYDESLNEDEIYDYLIKGEKFSTHPIAKSILKNNNKEIDVNNVIDVKEEQGGISYKINENTVKIGSKKFVNTKKTDCDIYITLNDNLIGGVILKTFIKPKVKETISYLKNNNINVKMFTGDKKDIAYTIASKVGIDDVRYELLPNEKKEELEKVQQEYKNVCFVGDGINDAAVLKYADLGISMGSKGSEIAIEASDIVLMTDDISKIKEGIKISKKTKRIILQNLCFAISTKIIILTFNLLGISGMWEAIFADVGTTLLTILNTLRILRKKL